MDEGVPSEQLRGVVVYADVSWLAEDPVVDQLSQYPRREPLATGFGAALWPLVFVGSTMAPPHNPDAVRQMCAFGPIANVFAEPAAVFWADWKASSLMSSIEEPNSFDGFAEETYEGYTVYLPEGRTNYVPAIGVLSADVYAVAPPSAVRTVIDVSRGADESLGDPYRDEITTEARGAVRCSIHPVPGSLFELDPEVLEPIDRALGSYVIDGEERTVEVEFAMATAEEAEELAGKLDSFLTDPNYNEAEESLVADDFGDLSVTTDGDELRLRYDTSVSAVEELGRQLRQSSRADQHG